MVKALKPDSEGAGRWYIDGYLYIETENAYYKIKTDRPKQTYVEELNGAILTFEHPPVVEDGRTIVSLRFLSENPGYTVTRNKKTSAASIVSDSAKNMQNADIQCTINGL